MVAATDPVAVIATFRDLGVPRRLATLVEGESLFNDATALVLFGATVELIGGEVGLGEAAADLVVTVAVSVGVGLGAGWLAVRLIGLSDEHVVELTISAAAAYGTYLLAEELRQSGIIATVVARRGHRDVWPDAGLSPRALEALDIVWELVAFLLTAIAFLLVGIAISAGDLAASAPWILWGLVGVVVGRALVVYGLLGGIARLLRGGIPRLPSRSAGCTCSSGPACAARSPWRWRCRCPRTSPSASCSSRSRSGSCSSPSSSRARRRVGWWRGQGVRGTD